MHDVPYRAIAESTYDWESWIDEDGVVRWVNPEVERLTGYSRRECLAMDGFPLAIVHEDDRARIADVLASAAAGGAGNDVELRVRHKDGSTRWVAVSWQPLHVGEGRTRGVRTSVRDIDTRKQAEERLREAERRASRLARDQAELLATLSHELRSPLHCISGFGELIERHDLPTDVQRYVQIMRAQSDAALRMVEDLLHFVSLAESHVTLRAVPFDLEALVATELEATRPRVREGVTIALEVEPGAEGAFTGDPDRIRQFVANLLSNAARFTERGAIDVHIRAADAWVELEVRDTGIGMSEGLLARVKDPFVQGAPSASSRGGVGLGLAIVERLVTAMGGDFVLSSVEGAGTSARVRIPLPRARVTSEAAAPAIPLERARMAALRILVVDDSEPARELLASMFRALGAHPDEAPNGERAIARSRTVAYDLVVIDYHMPELDGVATARRIRRQAGDHPPVLVLLTANVLAEAFSDPARHGLDVVLPKPLRLAQVSALAARVLDGQRMPSVQRSAPTSDGIDYEVVAELCDVRSVDGTSLLARTLPRVQAEVARVLAIVHGAIEDGTLADPSLARAVHGMKGLVASVGAVAAAARIAELEAALQGDACDIGERVAAIADAFENARRVLAVRA